MRYIFWQTVSLIINIIASPFMWAMQVYEWYHDGEINLIGAILISILCSPLMMATLAVCIIVDGLSCNFNYAEATMEVVDSFKKQPQE